MEPKAKVSAISSVDMEAAISFARIFYCYFFVLLLPCVSSGAYTLILRPTTLKRYEWTYLRVELPPSFASMTLNFMSDARNYTERTDGLSKSNLPLICFKDGSPPVPDISETHLNDLFVNHYLNGSIRSLDSLRVLEQCIPFQENITIILTAEQIPPGVWYIGFFNGLGPARTQSKMINRGQVYKFSTQISVEECPASSLFGVYCNKTIDMVSCFEYNGSKFTRNLLGADKFNSNGTSNILRDGSSFLQEKQTTNNSSFPVAMEKLISCNNSILSSCLRFAELRYFFVDILSVSTQLDIMPIKVILEGTPLLDDPSNSSEIFIMCYVRYNELPLANLFDHSADIRKTPLIVKFPKIGRWYVAIEAINQTKANVDVPESSTHGKLCFSFEWQVHICFNGKAGLNCTWESYTLQRVAKEGSVPFESYYVPTYGNEHPEDNEFPVEPLLSPYFDGVAWTYFFVNIPPDAAGVLHVYLVSDKSVIYELYSKYGGMPSIDTWDYYANNTSTSNATSFFVLDENVEEKIDFYILYPKGGVWCFGLRHYNDSYEKYRTAMSISLEGCPRHCSSNGECYYSIDQSGSAFYSFCSCDRDHGGFACRDVLVSHEGHIWQSIFLIASNGAAIFPAFWALRQKAFAEWVLFTSSGVSSALYHACDVGTWCVLTFRVLQFMDFWLSFMAVVSTFVFMSNINEASKRSIHTCVAILTALLAVTGATRSRNIIIVMAIGTLALLLAWMLEYLSSNRSLLSYPGFSLNAAARWENIKSRLFSLMKILQKRFQWPYVILGFIALAGAAICWQMESSNNYWIWHSLWHINIYTSSFLFLYSTLRQSSNEHHEPMYELAQQNPTSIEQEAVI